MAVLVVNKRTVTIQFKILMQMCIKERDKIIKFTPLKQAVKVYRRGSLINIIPYE